MTQNTLTSESVVCYEFRADGMRTRKLAVGTGQQEILYLHDGQNPIEEATFSNGPTRGAYTEIVRNGLGARGIDYVEVFKTGSPTSVRFPVYDGHGNMTACLLRDGAGGFTLTSRRAYDPWGAMRQWGTHPSGASAYQGAPSNRYVGSLGHQQDDDSGLYYMRARYYEPGSGRFISEDPARDGLNWYSYCENDPINKVDRTGCFSEVEGLINTAYAIFSSRQGWGFGTAQTSAALKAIVKRLEIIAKTSKLIGQHLIEEGLSDQERAACMGSASEMQQKIGEIKEGIGAMKLGEGAAAQVAIGVVKVMIELLKGNSTGPWDFWSR